MRFDRGGYTNFKTPASEIAISFKQLQKDQIIKQKKFQGDWKWIIAEKGEAKVFKSTEENEEDEIET